MKKLKCVMLIDENPDDNFLHERVLRKSGLVGNVITKLTATDALDYLKGRNAHEDTHPDLILLDINMPDMNGWEFLKEYSNLEKDFQSHTIVVLTSDPNDAEMASMRNMVLDSRMKPLTDEMLIDIVQKCF